ncbi:hypothetical protein Smic_70210 [Streptomyces microflavus]|uniref:Uncharacterized protein n=1 Tax=Streptomyces microflavus TaxID=1919 RepID=A0A7J0D3B8_STRMI|nr:hypothetical protein Smic_70210 [Streptomyces microflavus]
MGGGGHLGLEPRGPPDPLPYGLRLPEGVGGGGGQRAGDQGAQRGQDVQRAGPAHGSPPGLREAGDGDRPGGGGESAGEVADDGDAVGAHLGGAEQDGVAGPVHGVAPGLVADDVHPLADRRLAGLPHELGRGDGGGGVVGDGEHQQFRPAALGPYPAHGLQQGVRVGDAPAFGGRRHLVGGRAEQPGLGHPGGRAGAGHQDVTAVRGDQREEERLVAGGRHDVLRPAVQAAPGPVGAGRLSQAAAAAGRLGTGAVRRGGQDRRQFGDDGQAGVGGGRPVADGPVVLVHSGLLRRHRPRPFRYGSGALSGPFIRRFGPGRPPNCAPGGRWSPAGRSPAHAPVAGPPGGSWAVEPVAGATW